VASLITLIVGLQVRQGDDLWRSFIFPMFGLSACLSLEGFLIARWLVGKGLRFPGFFPAYLVIHGLAGFATMALVAAIQSAS
jgi:hypothetical protein